MSDKLNSLFLAMLLRIGQLKTGQAVTLDFYHSIRFYIRASNCQSRLSDIEEHEGWEETEIKYENLEVASFPFKEFMEDFYLRLGPTCHRSRQIGQDRDKMDFESVYEETVSQVH